MTNFDPRRAEYVHFATDDRIGLLAEARWRMTTGGSAEDWLRLGDDRLLPRREARDWIRAAVAAGILPLADEAQRHLEARNLARAQEEAEARYDEESYYLPVEDVPVSDVLSSTPLAVAFGGAMAAPNFAAGNLVNISDPGHKRYGQRGSVIGYVYDPLGVVVEYDNLGNTVTVRPDQLMHHDAFVEQESQAEFATEAASIPAQRDGEQADGGAL